MEDHGVTKISPLCSFVCGFGFQKSTNLWRGITDRSRGTLKIINCARPSLSSSRTPQPSMSHHPCLLARSFLAGTAEVKDGLIRCTTGNGEESFLPAAEVLDEVRNVSIGLNSGLSHRRHRLLPTATKICGGNAWSLFRAFAPPTERYLPGTWSPVTLPSITTPPFVLAVQMYGAVLWMEVLSP